jgi:hypothetical protein
VALAACGAFLAAAPPLSADTPPSPFPRIDIQAEPPRSHGWAYAALAGGAVLVGGSFLVAQRADQTYDDYLSETEPHRIEELYDRTVVYDNVARAALLTGEALLATGIYLRFIRRPRGATTSRASLVVEPTRCAVSFHF